MSDVIIIQTVTPETVIVEQKIADNVVVPSYLAPLGVGPQGPSGSIGPQGPTSSLALSASYALVAQNVLGSITSASYAATASSAAPSFVIGADVSGSSDPNTYALRVNSGLKVVGPIESWNNAANAVGVAIETSAVGTSSVEFRASDGSKRFAISGAMAASTANDRLTISHNNGAQPAITIDGSGRVGIGSTVNPQFNLDVSGSLNVSNTSSLANAVMSSSVIIKNLQVSGSVQVGVAPTTTYAFNADGNGYSGVFRGLWSNGSATFTITSPAGLADIILANAAATGMLVFGVSGFNRWQIDTSGVFEPVADNTYDIGRSTLRPRTLRIASASIVGTDLATFDAVRVSGSANYSGPVTASAFLGDGTQITNVVTASYAGTASAANTFFVGGPTTLLGPVEIARSLNRTANGLIFKAWDLAGWGYFLSTDSPAAPSLAQRPLLVKNWPFYVVGSGDASGSENTAAGIGLVTFDLAATGSTVRGSNLNFASSRTSLTAWNSGSYLALQGNDELGTVSFGGDNGATFRSAGAAIKALASQTWTTSSTPADLYFATTDTASANPTSRWWISNAGHFRAIVDNAYDIGTIAASRPRNIYVASTASLAHASGSFEGTIVATSSFGIVAPYVSGTFSPNKTSFFDRTDITIGLLAISNGQIHDVHYSINPNTTGSAAYANMYYGNMYIVGGWVNPNSGYSVQFNPVYQAEDTGSDASFSQTLTPYFTDGTILTPFAPIGSSSMWVRLQIVTSIPSGSTHSPKVNLVRMTQRF